jgi:hypothetical protein
MHLAFVVVVAVCLRSFRCKLGKILLDFGAVLLGLFAQMYTELQPKVINIGAGPRHGSSLICFEPIIGSVLEDQTPE